MKTIAKNDPLKTQTLISPLVWTVIKNALMAIAGGFAGYYLIVIIEVLARQNVGG